MRTFLWVLVVALTGLIACAITGTTGVVAATFTYDGPAIARVGVHAIDGSEASPAQLSDVREGSASPSAAAQGAASTHSPAFVATEAASVPGAAQLADEVAGATGGTVKQLSNGYSITVPSGSRGIVVRVMEEGGGRTNYYRVSISGKEAFTVDGVASVDRALTHIDIGSSSLDEILRIIKAAGG
jgi:hypothetical protein